MTDKIALADDREWLIQQLARWTDRVHPDRTTNITTLLRMAAAALRAEPTKPEVDREKVMAAMRIADERSYARGAYRDCRRYWEAVLDAAIAAMKGQP